jgi:ATP-binding cassette subfamily C protein CydCD
MTGMIVRLLRSVPQGPRRLLLAIVLGTAATGSSVALMSLAAWLLSRAAELPPVMYLTAAAVGVRFFGIGRGVFRYFERLVGHDLALRMQATLRLDAYDRLSRVTLLGSRRGDLLVRLTADVDAVMDVMVRVIMPFSSAALVIIATSLVIGMFSWSSAAVLLGTSVAAGVLFPWLGQRLSLRADVRAVPARGRLADEVRELARCAPDLVAYDAAEAALGRAQQTDLTLRRAEARAAWTRGLAAAGQMLATGAAVIAAMLIGGPMVVDGSMLARDLAVIMLTPLALHESFADLIKAAQALTRARSALARVQAVLDSPAVGSGDRIIPTAPQTGPSSSASTPEPSGNNRSATRTRGAESGEALAAAVLIASNLRIGWPGASPILEEVNLTVARGERVALTGASGVGKTTLAATIMGLIPTQGGELQVADRVGYLAQDAHIFATTIDENVRIGNKDASPEQVRQALARAGLSLDPQRIVGEEGATLSGGEARRLALARLLASDTEYDLVILDEPTEHLDHETAEALLADLWPALGEAGVLVITHDQELVAQCDRQVNLDEHARRPAPAEA